jgi:hypothetical protein
VTTTEADCLLLTVFTSTGASAFETPDRFWGMDLSVAKTGDNPLVSNPTQRAIVASRAQFTAGATPTYDYVSGIPGGVRSQIWNIAIKNKVGGAKPIGIANPPTRVFDYYEDNTFVTAATVLTSLSTIHATIDGQTTFAPATISNVLPVQGLITNNPPILFWYRAIRIARQLPRLACRVCVGTCLRQPITRRGCGCCFRNATVLIQTLWQASTTTLRTALEIGLSIGL